MRILCALALIALPGLPAAQQVDCGRDTTQTALNICAVEDYQRMDAVLNDAYRAALRSMGDARGEEMLRVAQRAWIPYRDAACAAEADQVRGGSMAPMVGALCLTRLTQARTQDLWILAR